MASISIPPNVSEALSAKGFDVDQSGVVRWSKNSRTHPRNWPFARKAFDTAVICLLEFCVTLVSNTGSTLAAKATKDFQIGREEALFCFTTTYMFGQATGGLLFPPVAETFGGRIIYTVSTFGYSMLCLWMAQYSYLLPLIAGGRFTTGLLSAMPAVVAAGSIENMWDVKARIWAINAWIGSAVLGLALGPTVGIYVSTSSLRWPWMFNIASIMTGVLTLLCFAMAESRPSQILREEIRAIRRKTKFAGLSLEDRDSRPALKAFIRNSLILPGKLFFTEPIVFLTSFMSATVTAVVYLFAEILPIIYVEGYDLTQRQSALVFLALGGGVIFSFLPRCYDIRIVQNYQKRMSVVEPEAKLLGFYIAVPLLATGLWTFGISVPPRAVNVTPRISVASLIVVGFSVVEFDTVLCGYLTDTYTTYAASANAPLAFLRAILCGIFPLFGLRFYETYGSNHAMFILAGCATAYCGVALFFALYGKRIRKRSPFAEKTWLKSQSGERLTLPVKRGQV